MDKTEACPYWETRLGKRHDHLAFPLGENQSYKNIERDCLFDYCHKTKKLKKASWRKTKKRT